jgi:hypothetical protein
MLLVYPTLTLIWISPDLLRTVVSVERGPRFNGCHLTPFGRLRRPPSNSMNSYILSFLVTENTTTTGDSTTMASTVSDDLSSVPLTDELEAPSEV